MIGTNNREDQEDQSQGDHLYQPAADGMVVSLSQSPGRVSLLTTVDEQMLPLNDTIDESTPIVLNTSFHSSDTDPLSSLPSPSSLVQSTDKLPSFPVVSTTMVLTPFSH